MGHGPPDCRVTLGRSPHLNLKSLSEGEMWVKRRGFQLIIPSSIPTPLQCIGIVSLHGHGCSNHAVDGLVRLCLLGKSPLFFHDCTSLPFSCPSSPYSSLLAFVSSPYSSPSYIQSLCVWSDVRPQRETGRSWPRRRVFILSRSSHSPCHTGGSLHLALLWLPAGPPSFISIGES